MITGLGRFFLHFGLTAFVFATIYMAVFNAYGLPVHPILAEMSGLFKLVGISTAVSGALAVAGRVFVLGSLAQAASYAVYLSIFGGAVLGIASVVGALLSIVPIPGAVNAALTGTVTSIASFSMYYYMATRVTALPPE